MASNLFSLLMVEDDLATRNIIEKMIEVKFQGCTIYCADNGKEGLLLFKERSPDLVVTDINMPEMNGIDMARAVREINKSTPFIVLTAYDDERFIASFTEIGYCNFLKKPVDFAELFASIEKCMPR